MFSINIKKILLVILASYLASCSIPKTDFEQDQNTLLTIDKGSIIGSNNGNTYVYIRRVCIEYIRGHFLLNIYIYIYIYMRAR